MGAVQAKNQIVLLINLTRIELLMPRALHNDVNAFYIIKIFSFKATFCIDKSIFQLFFISKRLLFMSRIRQILVLKKLTRRMDALSKKIAIGAYRKAVICVLIRFHSGFE